ncbi:DUF2254 family protein [Streptomyces sp. NPDC093600]|uniref:DUF2254 family protein n=1 Tax=Streptomyces sp. NPDC093600 TaxID=3366047 RepID=UPI00382AEB04
MTPTAPWRRTNRLHAGRTQLLFTLTGLGLGLALPRVSVGPQLAARQVTDMLLGLGFGVLGVSGIIFSLLFLVVQWAHTTFTPRLTLFRQEPVVWRTFAFALALAVFCITAALTIGTRPSVSVSVPVLAGILLLILLTLLRSLQMHAFASIQIAPVLHEVTARGRAILEPLRPQEPESGPSPTKATVLPPLTSAVTWPASMTVLQQVDGERLLEAAQEANAVVVLHTIPGTTVHRGTRVADVHGGQLAPPAVLDALVTGVERTFEQDPLLAFQLLADIALRALSPAVNDPASAVHALDCLQDLLSAPGPGRETAGWLRITDPEGVVRVLMRLPDGEAFLRTSLDDIIAAANSPAVLLRLRGVLQYLRAGHTFRDEALTRRLAWVESELAERFPVVWSETVTGPGREAS